MFQSHIAFCGDHESEKTQSGSTVGLFTHLCTKILTIYQTRIGPTQSVPKPTVETDKKPTVTVATRVADNTPEGETYELSKQPNATWNSGYIENENDIHGNPKTLINLTDLHFAKKAGIEMVGPNRLWVAAPKSLGAALRKENEFYPEDLAFIVSFYRVNGLATGRDYLEKFIYEAALPISTSSVMVHDVSYHLPFFLATPAIVRHLQDQARLGLLLFDHLKSRGIGDFHLNQIIKAYETHIDLATGGFEYSYARLDPFPRHLQSPKQVLSQLLQTHTVPIFVESQIIEFLNLFRPEDWTDTKLSRKEFNYNIRIRKHQIANM